MEVQFNPRGDPERLGRILKQSVENVDKIGEELAKTNAEIYYEAIMDNVVGQKLSWKPLTPGYVARKGILGLDTRVLIATGEYVNNIDIRKLPDRGSKLRFHVGVDPDATHSSGINMGLLSLILEYGTADGRIPARPHFSATWSQVLKKVQTNTLKYARKIWQMDTK